MENFWLTILSILISIFLAMLTYRQTIGARKERVRSANSELEKVLIRRVVLESYQPTVEDISRLINGKARDCRVRRGDLLSETQLLENLFIRITESDFMTQDQRNSILERLSPLFVKAEKAFEEEIEEIEIPTSEKENNIRNTPMFIIGFVASFLGVTAMTIFWLISENSAFPTTSLIIAFVGSLAAIVGIFSVYRLRESPEEPNARSAARSAIDFESDVIRRFTKSNIPIVISSRDSGYDFLINVGDKKILIEVKSWHRRPSINLLKNTVDRLSRAVQNQNAYEGIIVTKEPLKLPSNLLKDAKINFMSLTELRNYITHDLNILR